MARGNLPVPIRRVLRDPADERTLQRMWTQIEVRRTERRRRIPAWSLGIAVAAATAVTLMVVIDELPWQASQPLQLSNGHEPGILETKGPRRAHWQFSDGSKLVVAPHTRLRVVRNTPTAMVMALEQGRARYVVEKRTERTWQVDCGLAIVEVTGTKFWAERLEHEVKVAVQEGSVLVRSPYLARGAQTLRASEQVTINKPLPPVPKQSVSSPVSLPTPTARTHPVAPEPVPTEPKLTWQQAAAQGDFAQVATIVDAQGLERTLEAIVDPETLIQLSDSLRIAGRYRQAVQALRYFNQRFSQDPRASQVAFSLGKLYLEQLRDPRQAAQVFEDLVEHGAPAGLIDDVYLRWIEALVKSGQKSKAKLVADDYIQKYPSGHRIQDIKQWLEAE